METRLQGTAPFLDAIRHTVLVFDLDGKLVYANPSAGNVLGADLAVIQREGWPAAVHLLDAQVQGGYADLDALRLEAMHARTPQHLRVLCRGAITPATLAVVDHEDGALDTVLTLDCVDWGVVDDMIAVFDRELSDAIASTRGHIMLIEKTLATASAADDATRIARRVQGFSTLILVHSTRAERLMRLFRRMQAIRTGRIEALAVERNQALDLQIFFEDLIEGLDEADILDPETTRQGLRARISSAVGAGLVVMVAEDYLRDVVHDILRNAAMYSLRGSPIQIRAFDTGSAVQIDIADEGYGIPRKDWMAVFAPFQRARQPQIISEFGYGVALFLARYEVEAMGGRLWFTSDEGIGTTLHLQLVRA
jgi:signal transduction histidine kinase